MSVSRIIYCIITEPLFNFNLHLTSHSVLEIAVPEFELPPVDDSDHNGATDSLKEQEQKWTDLGIQQLQESPQHTGN